MFSLSKILPLTGFIAGVLFYFYEFFLRILPGIYQEDITDKMNLSHLGFSILVTSYNITYLAMQIPAGMIIDRFGPKKAIIFGIVLCALGNLVFTDSNFIISIIGRMAVGLGSAFGFISALHIAYLYLSKKYFTFLAGLIIGIGTMVGAYAQQISVSLFSNYSYEATFVFASLISAPVLIVVLLGLGNKSTHQQKNTYDSNISFVHQAGKNMLTLFKNKFLILTAIIGGLLYAPVAVLSMQWGAFFFHNTYGLENIVSASLITALLVGGCLAGPLLGYLTDITKRPKLILIVFSILSFIMLYILVFSPYLTLNFLGTFMFIFGAVSASQVIIWRLFTRYCPKGMVAIGIATCNMIITGTVELIQLITGFLLDKASNQTYFTQAQFGFSIIFIGIILGILGVYFLKNSKTGMITS